MFARGVIKPPNPWGVGKDAAGRASHDFPVHLAPLPLREGAAVEFERAAADRVIIRGGSDVPGVQFG